MANVVGITESCIRVMKSTRVAPSETVGISDSGLRPAKSVRIAPAQVIGITDDMRRANFLVKIYGEIINIFHPSYKVIHIMAGEVIGITEAGLRCSKMVKLMPNTVNIVSGVESITTLIAMTEGSNVGISESSVRRGKSVRIAPSQIVGITDAFILRLNFLPTLILKFANDVIGITESTIRRGKVLLFTPNVIAVAEGWIQPTSWTTETNKWNYGERSYDLDPSTRAECVGIEGQDWTEFIYLYFTSPVNCDAIRTWLSSDEATKQFDIDAYYGGVWNHVNQGTFTDNAYTQSNIGTVVAVSMLRLRMYCPGSMIMPMAYIHEVAVQQRNPYPTFKVGKSVRIVNELIRLTDSYIRRGKIIRIADEEIIGITESMYYRMQSLYGTIIRITSEVIGITDSGVRRARSIRIISEGIGILESIVKKGFAPISNDIIVITSSMDTEFDIVSVATTDFDIISSMEAH